MTQALPDLSANLGFWIGLGQIILVNIVLSGDNALVIALAARSLPEAQRRSAVLWGSVAAIAIRLVLTLVALELLRQPFLKLIGSALLFWIALQLFVPCEDGSDGISSRKHLLGAIRTILLADLVMSLDNVVAVAAAAKGDTLLLMIGLGVSIPLVMFGSSLVLRLMDRMPAVIELGAALIAFVAGEMLVSDPAVAPWFAASEIFWLGDVIPLVAAGAVVVGGYGLAQRERRRRTVQLVDLAGGEQPDQEA